MFVKQGDTHLTHLTCELWVHKCLAEWLTQSSGCNYGKNCSIAQQYFCNFKILDDAVKTTEGGSNAAIASHATAPAQAASKHFHI